MDVSLVCCCAEICDGPQARGGLIVQRGDEAVVLEPVTTGFTAALRRLEPPGARARRNWPSSSAAVMVLLGSNAGHCCLRTSPGAAFCCTSRARTASRWQP